MVSVVMLVTCLTCLTVLPVWSQLIGSRGVISLRPGQLYRDRLTVEASEVAARLALLLDREERLLGRHRGFRWREHSTFLHLQVISSFVYRIPFREAPPVYPTVVGGIGVGRRLQDDEIFDHYDSRFVRPPPVQQFNQLLEEVEVERATSPTRTFPGQGLPPGIHPGPTRPPNRLANLAVPTEPSQRTKNAIFGTVFDSPQRPHITPFVYLGQEEPQLVSPPLSTNSLGHPGQLHHGEDLHLHGHPQHLLGNSQPSPPGPSVFPGTRGASHSQEHPSRFVIPSIRGLRSELFVS